MCCIKMKFLLSLIITAVLSPLNVLAVNHFRGVTVSNSIGNTGTYTCRTQAQWNQVANDAAGLGMVAIRISGFGSIHFISVLDGLLTFPRLQRPSHGFRCLRPSQHWPPCWNLHPCMFYERFCVDHRAYEIQGTVAASITDIKYASLDCLYGPCTDLTAAIKSKISAMLWPSTDNPVILRSPSETR